MPKLPLLAAIAVVAAACVTVPFVGWALDVNDEDAVIDAFLDHMDWEDADPDDICVLTDPTFPDVALVAGFAYDRGCATEAIYVDGAWLHPTAASAEALALAGWDEADDARRAALALEWADFATFAFAHPIGSANDDFARPEAAAFVAPKAEPDGAGGVVVTMWVEEPAGMLPESEYNLWELTFDRDGKTVRVRVLDSFTVQY